MIATIAGALIILTVLWICGFVMHTIDGEEFPKIVSMKSMMAELWFAITGVALVMALGLFSYVIGKGLGL